MGIISNGITIIDNGAIGSDKVDTVQIAASAVETAKIADAQITLAKLSATGTKDATTFLRGDNTFAAAGGGVNTPAFRAYQTSIQTGIQNFSKILVPNEEFDTDGAFSSSRFTVPSGKGGIYVFGMGISVTISPINSAKFVLYKNGSSQIQTANLAFSTKEFSDTGFNPTFVTNANAGDYFEFYYQVIGITGGQTAPNSAAQQFVWFWGYRLIQ